MTTRARELAVLGRLRRDHVAHRRRGVVLRQPQPDGLDSATLKGCEVVESGGTEALTGSCIAQHATDHAMGSTLLADAVDGKDGTGGMAGIIGVVVTVAVAGAAFWLIARTKSKSDTGS